MDNLDGMHHHHHHHIGGGASGGVGNGLCHPTATPTVNSNHLPDHAAVTVTVGGPSVMLHRSSSSSSTSSGMFSPPPPSSSSEINLNASAIVATDCCSGNHVMSFEETKQLLAKHLQETTRRCCGGVVSATTSSSSSSSTTAAVTPHHESHNLPPAYAEEEANFDGIDLDDQTPVALGDILEKLQEETQLAKADDFIRLHGGVESPAATISATVNVATLDLSDPESIHRHLSQLNDTVLRVTTHEDMMHHQHSTTSSTMTTTASTTSSAIESEFFDQHSNQDDGNQSKQSSPPISISISSTTNNNNSNVSVQTEELKSPSEKTGLTISTPGNKKVLNRKSNSSSGGKASPQSCSVCSKVFSNASALAKHRLTHSEERRYHCNICGKAFKRQDHLNGHLLTHRSTKPFACHVEGCGKSYCDARSLRRHKENHHGQAKPEKPAATAAAASTSDNQASENKSSNDSSSSTIMSGPDHLISKSNVLGDTKIKFSSKGLTAQQLQLIEQLFKQSKSKANQQQAVAAASSEQKEKNAPLNANNIKKTGGSSSNSSSSLSADKQQLPDKPVECTICSRKFKNIPALNGHMRLHGGYYKKDADGRRMVGMAQQPLKTALNMANKRKVGDQSTSPPQKKCLTVTYCPPPPQPQVTSGSMPSFAFSNLPQPDTSKLLANLEQKAKEMMTTSESTSSSSSSTSTTSSLRALRKPTTTTSSASSATPKKVPCCQQQSEDPQQIATLINTQPLSLPLVALPTKPLPVQMTAVTTSQDSNTVLDHPHTSKTSNNCIDNMMNHVSSNSTSIQITALIQSNPIINNTIVSSANSSVHDFVQGNHQQQDMMVNNMLSCMQQSINVHQNGHQQQTTAQHHHYHHYGHHHHSHQSNNTNLNLLKVDESADKTPKIGDNHQASIPDLLHLDLSELSTEEQAPLWQPETAECLSDVELNQYLLLASSCVVSGGSHNEEVALEILQKHEGHVQNALQELLSSYDMTGNADEDSLSLFSSQESDSEDDHCLLTTPPPPSTSTKTKPWQPFEVDLFYEGLVRYHKDFNKVSKHVGSKSVKDCVEFYYLWKNICFEESQSFKSLFSQQQQQQQTSMVNVDDQSNTTNSSNSMSEQHHHVSSVV